MSTEPTDAPRRTYDPRSPERSVRLWTRTDPETREVIHAAARRRGMTTADFVLDAVLAAAGATK